MKYITEVLELDNINNENVKVVENVEYVRVVESFDLSGDTLMSESFYDNNLTYQSLAIISLDEFYKHFQG